MNCKIPAILSDYNLKKNILCKKIKEKQGKISGSAFLRTTALCL